MKKHNLDPLINRLGLPQIEWWDQNWEYRVADYTRLEEFIQAYPEFNESEIKLSLMMIIIEAFNDYMSIFETDNDMWNRIVKLLIKDISIHKETLEYWALYPEEDEEDNLEDCFIITPLIRPLLISLHTL